MYKALYIDESERNKTFFLVGCQISPNHRKHASKTLRSLRLSGQQRIHLNSESDNRRKYIVNEIAKLEFDSVIVRTNFQGTNKIARQTCIRALAEFAFNQGVTHMVIELNTSIEADTKTLQHARSQWPNVSCIFSHMPPQSEPLLWLPDIVAWTFGRGQEWRRMLESKITKVFEL